MPTTRSQSAVTGGLPDASPGWLEPRHPTGRSDAQRTATARAARNQNRAINDDNDGTAVAQGVVPEGGNEALGARLPGTGLPGAGLLGVNLHNRGPPCKVWMGIQACGAPSSDVAKSLGRNLFMDNFTMCLKVTREDIKDTFKSLEKRLKNDVMVELCIEDIVG